MNERDLNFSKVDIFFYLIQKFENPKMLFNGFDVYL